MKNYTDLDTLGRCSFKVCQEVRWPRFSAFAVSNRQIYRRAAARTPANDRYVCDLWRALLGVWRAIANQPFEQGSFFRAEGSPFWLNELRHLGAYTFWKPFRLIEAQT